jgi:hypothetical protein
VSEENLATAIINVSPVVMDPGLRRDNDLHPSSLRGAFATIASLRSQ